MIAHKIDKFRKEAILNYHFWLRGVVLEDLDTFLSILTNFHF